MTCTTKHIYSKALLDGMLIGEGPLLKERELVSYNNAALRHEVNPLSNLVYG